MYGEDSWLEMAYEDRYEPEFDHVATPGEAHAEWHRNAGVPMGQPGCPQDACHPAYDPDEYFEDADYPEDEPADDGEEEPLSAADEEELYDPWEGI